MHPLARARYDPRWASPCRVRSETGAPIGQAIVAATTPMPPTTPAPMIQRHHRI